MAESTYGFRNALSGYHKGDVTGFIEKMATQHRAELLEYEKTIITLQEENRSLQQQLNLLMMATPLPQEPAPIPEAVELAPTPEPELVPIHTEKVTTQQEMMELELLAYRRAEAAERSANNRVKKLYRQMEELCEDTMEDFRVTDAAVKQTVEKILVQAKDLERSYNALSNALMASRERIAAMNGLFREDTIE